MQVLKWIIGFLVLIFIVIQFYPVHLPKNSQNTDSLFIASFESNKKVEQILKTSCFDCHSNQVNYPWYSHIAPFSWILSDHITEGKKALNISEWSNYSKLRQIRKLSDIKEQIKLEMPLNSYTLIHRNAELSTSDKELISDWCSNFSNNTLNNK